MCVYVCVCLSFPHQRLWWKLFTLLSGMQASAQRWLAKLLFYKRSTKNYQGIKGDKKGFIEFGVQSSPNHASWVLPLHRSSPRQIWSKSSSVYMAFIATKKNLLACVLWDVRQPHIAEYFIYLYDLYAVHLFSYLKTAQDIDNRSVIHPKTRHLVVIFIHK